MIDEPVATEDVEDGPPFGGGEFVLRGARGGADRRGRLRQDGPSRAAVERTTPVSVVACPGRYTGRR